MEVEDYERLKGAWIKKQVTYLYKQFLSNRSFKVRTGDTLSETSTQEMGVS